MKESPDVPQSCLPIRGFVQIRPGNGTGELTRAEIGNGNAATKRRNTVQLDRRALFWIYLRVQDPNRKSMFLFYQADCLYQVRVIGYYDGCLK